MLDHYTTPGESIEIRDNQTIYSLLTDRLARTGADTVIAAKKIGPGRWQNVTTGEFHERVVSAAKGLIALGIAKGDAVTIFSTTRYEWGVLDFALAAIGAVNVPIYDTDSAAQAERIINDSGVKLAVTDNRERYDRLDSINDRCPGLQRILMMDGNALGALEGLGVSVSDEELEARIAYFNELLSSEEKIRGVLKDELTAIRDRYGDDRVTEIQDVEDEIDIEDLIEEEECVFTLTENGYIKRTAVSEYAAQSKGGMGKKGITTRDEDTVVDVFTASTHDYILFFTDTGKVYRKKGYQIPESGKAAKVNPLKASKRAAKGR